MIVVTLLCSVLMFGYQEEKKNPQAEEVIVVEVPNFYSNLLRFSGDFYDPKLLNSPPRGVKRKYFIKIMDELGELHETKEIYEAEFYNFANEILHYGLLESTTFSYYLNIGYRKFVKSLLRYKIIDREALVYSGKSYFNRDMIESVYCLDDVIPILTAKEWSRIAEFYNPGVNAVSKYFRTLALIKRGDPVNGIRAWLDVMFWQEENKPGEHFNFFAKAYGELIRNGAVFPESAQKILFRSYVRSDPRFEKGILKTYAIAGLPLPEKKIVQQALLDRLKDVWVFDESILGTVREFRAFGIEPPIDLAKSYRDELLKNYQGLDDILFLIKCAGEDGDPALWKKYADFNLRAYKTKEALNECKDRGDHYHAAIEGYRRAAASGNQLSPATARSLLKAEDDPLVHIRDLIIAYELAGYDPRCRIIMEKLESRIEILDKRSAGASFDDYGDIIWQKNEYGERIIPFREEIELAAYLNDPERTRELSRKIAQYALERLKQEGPELLKKFKSDWHYRNCQNLWLYSVFAFEMPLRSLDTPIYAELAVIIDVYESLGFKDGARSLAQHLLGDAGFYIPARRAFRIGGFGKRAEEVLYGQRDDFYWQKIQSEFSAKVRRKAILKK